MRLCATGLKSWVMSGLVAAGIGLGGGSFGAVLDPVPLWAEGAPGALGDTEADRPTLTPYLVDGEPVAGGRAAIVVCPGGGYGGLASHEGKDYALWLNERGLHAFVLRYRLGSRGYRHPVMLNDAARAVRLTRARAKEWGVDPNRVGIMGSSAGGHLASTLLTHYDAGDSAASDPVERESSRPDLGILCYPVITMGEYTHQGSRRNLLGASPDPALVQLLSNETQVTADTPPTFVWHTVEDQAVPVQNSIAFAEALQAAGRPYELHIFEKGRHGIGLANGHPWTHALAFWLKGRGFIPE
jgi:acetyl esterase/lipase